MRIEAVPGVMPPRYAVDVIAQHLAPLSMPFSGGGSEYVIALRNELGQVAIEVQCEGLREADACSLFFRYLGFQQAMSRSAAEAKRYWAVFG